MDSKDSKFFTPPKLPGYAVMTSTLILRGWEISLLGITSSNTPCLPIAEILSASAVSGKLNRR